MLNSRFAVVVAQLDASKAAEHQIEAREEHHDERAHVVPIERMLDPFANRRIDAVGEVDEEGREHDECRNHTLGRYAHAGVQPLPETSASDAFRDLILHRPHPSRSAPIRIRLRRGSGSGRAAKSASLPPPMPGDNHTGRPVAQRPPTLSASPNAPTAQTRSPRRRNGPLRCEASVLAAYSHGSRCGIGLR